MFYLINRENGIWTFVVVDRIECTVLDEKW